MDTTTLIATTGAGLARATSSDHDRWHVEALLEGERVRCLAADPLRPDVVYAASDERGILCSEDRGQSWQRVGDPGRPVRSLAASPHVEGRLYAGAKPASIIVSEDRGGNWRELEGFRSVRRWYWFSPADPPGFAPYVLGLALSPTDPNVIVVGVEAGAVLRSEDGGRTWSGHRPGAERDCHSMTFHHANGDWIYEAGGGGPALSRDAGRTWQRPKHGLHGRYCWACAADPARPEVWYVSAAPSFSLRHFTPRAHVDGDADAAIYRASGGAEWERLTGGLPQPLDHMPYALCTDPRAPGRLYAGLASGEVWLSSDYGDTWRRLPFNLGGIYRSMILLDYD